MEFVIVNFSTSRMVHIDGAPRGRTGLLLRVQAGTHTFDLGPPPNYSPSSVMTPVLGTTPTSPMVIAFVPISSVPPSAAAARMARAPKARARKRVRRATAKKKSAKGARTSGRGRARKPKGR